jgi:hypothetical protein
MLAFRPPAFAPLGPTLRGALLAQEQMPVVTPGQIKAVGTGAGLISTALGAAAAWVGFRTGSKESGLLSVAGYTVGVAGAFIGLFSLIGAVRIIAIPSMEIQQMINEAAQRAREKQAAAAPAPAPAAPAPRTTYEM